MADSENSPLDLEHTPIETPVGDTTGPDLTKAEIQEARKAQVAAEQRAQDLAIRVARLEGASEATRRVVPKQEIPIPEIDYEHLDESIPAIVKATVDRILSEKDSGSDKARANRFQKRLEASMDSCESAHEDYAETLKVWDDHWNSVVAKGKDPQTMERFLASGDPAEYAYRWAKRAQKKGLETVSLSEKDKRIAELEEKVAALEGGDKGTKPKPRLSVAAANGRGAKTGKEALDEESILDDACEGR